MKSANLNAKKLNQKHPKDRSRCNKRQTFEKSETGEIVGERTGMGNHFQL